jgi:hypothetical protein
MLILHRSGGRVIAVLAHQVRAKGTKQAPDHLDRLPDPINDARFKAVGGCDCP